MRAGLVALVAIWVAAVFAIGEAEMLGTGSPRAFRPVLITVIVPVALFLAGYAASPRLRRFVLAQDMAMLTMLQH